MPGERFDRIPNMVLLQAAAVVAAGLLFSLECWLSPGFPAAMLFLFEDRQLAFLWAGAAAAVLGLAYWRLVLWLRGGGKAAKPNRLAFAVAAGLGGTLMALAAATSATIQLYAVLIFLFPCSIMVYGAASGRLWGVALGLSLQLLISATSGGGARDIAELLVFAGTFLAAAELAWSASYYRSVLESELAEAQDDRRRKVALDAVSGAVRSYWAAFATTLAVALIVLSAALAVFANPTLFGEAYRKSLISTGIIAFALPAGAALAVMAGILLLPRDLPRRARLAFLRARLELVRRWPNLRVKATSKSAPASTDL